MQNLAEMQADDLNEAPASKTEADMLARLASLDPGTQRYNVLQTAIDFKRSWVRLGQHLTEVQRTGAFKEWGYRTYEAYARHELHLRRDTAHKLARSFEFLSQHEPELLSAKGSGRGDVVLPGYQALDALAEARKSQYLSEDDYREIRDQVFREDPSPAKIRRMVRDRANDMPEPEPEPPAQRFRRCLSTAERLYGMLLECDAPEPIRESVESAIGGLRRLVEE